MHLYIDWYKYTLWLKILDLCCTNISAFWQSGNMYKIRVFSSLSVCVYQVCFPHCSIFQFLVFKITYLLLICDQVSSFYILNLILKIDKRFQSLVTFIFHLKLHKGLILWFQRSIHEFTSNICVAGEWSPLALQKDAFDFTVPSMYLHIAKISFCNT